MKGGGSGNKGISPLLATVLLVAVTVVISTMLAGWMSSTTSITQVIIANKTSEGVVCAAAEIVIDDVYSGAGSGGIARAIVRNSGDSDNLQLVSAQLYDKLGNNFTTVSSLPTSLNKGQMATLSFNYTILPTTTNDSSHGINNGTLNNGPNWTLDGKYGSALVFDGVNDYVNVTNSQSLQTINVSGTIEAWVIIRANTGDLQCIICPTDTGAQRVLMYQNNDGSVRFSYDIGGTDTVYLDTIVPFNQWTHLAGTWNSSGGVVYNNGIRIASNGSVPNITINEANTFIGAQSAAYRVVNGIIDDVAIWNRSLTNVEINTSISAGSLIVSNTNDLVGYWKFDEGKGVLSCPSDFSRVVVTTSCGGISTEFSKSPKC